MLTIATSNRIQFCYGLEKKPGQIPASAFRNLRIRNQSLQQNLTYTQSNELRPDAQVAGFIETDQSPNGSIGVELSYGTFDDLIAAALMGNWSPSTIITGSNIGISGKGQLISSTINKFVGLVPSQLLRLNGFTNRTNNNDFQIKAVNSGSSLTLTNSDFLVTEAAGPEIKLEVIGFRAMNDIAILKPSNGISSSELDFTSLSLAEGQWISLSGFANVQNNQLARITSVAPHFLGLDSIQLVPEPAPAVVTARTSSFIRNGTSPATFTIERQHLDIGQFFTFSGMMIEQMQFDLKSGQVIEGNFKMRGMKAALKQATSSAQSILPTTATPVMNAVTNVVKLCEAGMPATAIIKNLTLRTDVALRNQKAVGVLGNIGIGTGLFGAELVLEAYFTDQSLYSKYINGISTTLSFSLKDSVSNILVFTLPNVTLNACQIQAQGINQDVMMNITAKASIDALTGVMFQIDRIFA